jgi:hypothetical protein
MIISSALIEVGYLGDDDLERKTQAEVLLNAFSRELERRRLAAGAQGLLISTGGTILSKLLITTLSADMPR